MLKYPPCQIADVAEYAHRAEDHKNTSLQKYRYKLEDRVVQKIKINALLWSHVLQI
jgi:hypothetical protein